MQLFWKCKYAMNNKLIDRNQNNGETIIGFVCVFHEQGKGDDGKDESTRMKDDVQEKRKENEQRTLGFYEGTAEQNQSSVFYEELDPIIVYMCGTVYSSQCFCGYYSI